MSDKGNKLTREAADVCQAALRGVATYLSVNEVDEMGGMDLTIGMLSAAIVMARASLDPNAPEGLSLELIKKFCEEQQDNKKLRDESRAVWHELCRQTGFVMAERRPDGTEVLPMEPKVVLSQQAQEFLGDESVPEDVRQKVAEIIGLLKQGKLPEGSTPLTDEEADELLSNVDPAKLKPASVH